MFAVYASLGSPVKRLTQSLLSSSSKSMLSALLSLSESCWPAAFGPVPFTCDVPLGAPRRSEKLQHCGTSEFRSEVNIPWPEALRSSCSVFCTESLTPTKNVGLDSEETSDTARSTIGYLVSRGFSSKQFVSRRSGGRTSRALA